MPVLAAAALEGRSVRMRRTWLKGDPRDVALQLEAGAVFLVEKAFEAPAGYTLVLSDAGRSFQVWGVPLGLVEVLPKCKTCGCTELRACPGGCAWVSADECSSCRPDLYNALLADARRRESGEPAGRRNKA